jgi:GT2 family glycosyltransferase
MKLLIAVPALDYIPADFVKSLTALIQRLDSDGYQADVKILTGTLVYAARDRLAAHAIMNDYTHVLWLDADMVFDDELLYDLQFAHKDFVTGLARSRRWPYTSCVFKSLEYLERIEKYPRDTFRIGGCGFACVLIKTEILKTVREQYHTCFLPTADLGEDLAFCQRAAAMGYEIWAEPAVKVGHIGHITIYPDDAEALQRINMEARDA